MKRKIKKEAIIVDGKEISFISYAQDCYNKKKEAGGLDWYITKNKLTLQIGWDAIKIAAKEGHARAIEAEHKEQNKIVNKVKKLLKELF